MRLRCFALLGLLAACLVQAATEGAKAFDPAAAFAGRSEGRGTLRYLLGKERPYRVDNVGTALTDGSFQLEQTIRFEGETPRERRWVIREEGPGRYSFTLSEASGPGEARVAGPRLSLRYRAGRGIAVEQDLTLEADGRIDNDGRIFFLGIPIGRLHETITPLARRTSP